MSEWTHPICLECYQNRNADQEPSVIRIPYRDRERCCFCGRDTDAGIYIREDPKRTPYHT